MNKSHPPPVPSAGSARSALTSRGGDYPGYNLMADKIGGVPNFRKKDNLYQAIGIGVFLIVGVLVGGVAGGWPEGVLVGGLAGLIAGVLISGAVLMVIGLFRPR